MSSKDVSKAIRAGLVQRGWVVLKDEKGHIDSVLNVRKHEVRVGLDYNPKTITIKYVSSQNLDYDEKGGVRHIHKKYNQWIANMVQDIQTQLQTASIQHE